MSIQYKQKCNKCKKNYVLSSWSNKYPICYDCQKSEMGGAVSDAKMKKMFNISEELYINNSFLRDIKIKYLRFGSLSDRQIEAFKKTADKMLKEKKK